MRDICMLDLRAWGFEFESLGFWGIKNTLTQYVYLPFLLTLIFAPQRCSNPKSNWGRLQEGQIKVGSAVCDSFKGVIAAHRDI